MAFRPFPETTFSITNLQDEMNNLLNRIWHAGVSTGPLDGQSWAPLIDLVEGDDAYTLYADMPGVNGADVELTHVGNTLTLRGERGKPEGVADDSRRLRGERRFGPFCRAIDLPDGIDADRLSAKFSAGVMEVTIPKSESSRPKTVKVDVREA